MSLSPSRRLLEACLFVGASRGAAALAATRGGRSLLVLGGSGFVGREVCRNAVERGYRVTSLSRRGVNPEPASALLAQVQWLSLIHI